MEDGKNVMIGLKDMTYVDNIIDPNDSGFRADETEYVAGKEDSNGNIQVPVSGESYYLSRYLGYDN